MQMIETKTAIDGYGIMNTNNLQQIVTSALTHALTHSLTHALTQIKLDGLNLDNLRRDTTGMSTEEHDMSRERRRVMIGTHDDGTPIYKNIQASSAQEMNDRIVQEYIDSGLIHEMMNAPGTQASRRTPFSLYAEKLMEKIEAEKAVNTAKAYGNAMKVHILPTFGDRAIEEITWQEIQEWMDERKEYAKQSVQLYRIILGQALEMAVSDDIIQKNPARSKYLHNPATKEAVREALTKEQMRSIQSELHKLEPIDQCMLALYMTTGMRKGETLGLRWEDINFERNTVSIQRQYDCRNSQIKPPKRGSNGVVPLAKWAKDILLRHRKDKGYVLSVREGKPMCSRTYSRRFKGIQSVIDLFGATGHVFRHTAISMVYHDCKDLSNTQGYARHKSLTVTQKYIHPEKEKVLAFGRIFDSIMNKDAGAA